VSGALLDSLTGPTTLRIGVTGLARAGKTALLTSIAANLLAYGQRVPTLPALSTALSGRRLRVALAPAGAVDLPRFDYASHLAALAADPPRWPARTDAISLLALDLQLDRTGLFATLPPRRLRLEFLDYPGEWLLDLPLLRQDFSDWSAAALSRLGQPDSAPIAAPFLAFTKSLPPRAAADEALASTGHRLYRAALHRLRDDAGLSLLQPGRFLMPAPGPPPPWMTFFPMHGAGALAALMRDRYQAYGEAVQRDLLSPLFGRVDRLIVLADLLSALHAGPAAYADAAAALSEAAGALRWQSAWPDWLGVLNRALPAFLQPGGIRRIAYVASKADHIADRQRGNLARLVGALANTPADSRPTLATTAAIRCTEDFVWTLDGHPVSAVRGRVLGDERLTRSYPGEVPDRPPGPDFWAHRFLALPQFEPMRLPDGGRGGAPQLGLDSLLSFLLQDVL
jgi:predicted YcjX-like family ATPase